MSQFVYALFNEENNKIYIGQTNDLSRRIKEHNTKSLNKGHFTAHFQGQWKLIYKEEAANRSIAIARERELKSHQGRNFLKQYIPG
ncbi:MAG: GIY-YIG nuclease family protein [Patescibacteria group bacterium]|nr:GIY-YIG nuclease family protein [Patescibacteria group bacterium]